MRQVKLFDLIDAAAQPGEPDRERLAARLMASVDEITAAVEHALRTDTDTALHVLGSLAWLWQDAGRVEEGRRLTEQAIDQATEAATPALARSLVAGAELAFRQGDQVQAERHSRRAIEVGERAGDVGAVGLGYINLARIAYRDGDASAIESYAQRAIDVAGTDVAVRRGGLHMLAWASHTRGDLSEALRRFEESLDFRKRLGDRFGVASESANIGDLAVEEGDLVEGAQRLGEALSVARDLESTYLVVNLLPSLAVVAARTGEYDECARLIGATDAISESSGLIPDPGPWRSITQEVTASLGERFELVRAEGAALDEDGAIELGLQIARRVPSGSWVADLSRTSDRGVAPGAVADGP